LNLFNIPVARPFFSSFVKALLAGEIIDAIGPGRDPLSLAGLTVFVPTRRAARALAQVLSSQLSPSPAILPKIAPLGDPADLDERSLLSDEMFMGAGTLAPEIAPLSRQLHLMQLIEGWRIAIRASLSQVTSTGKALLTPEDLFQVASSPYDAFSLAGDLANLMDEMIIEQVDWSELQKLVTTHQALGHDRYWDITIRFLEIASQSWPHYLADNNVVDASARRQALLQFETQRLLRERPAQPMIVAGSTGSQPATAQLMAAIAKLPNGAIILPGLDRHLSNEDWDKIVTTGSDMALGLTSPQANLKRLLDIRMKCSRLDVKDIGQDEHEWAKSRRNLVSEILRPADTTDQWITAGNKNQNQLACQGLSLIETTDEREEALAIAALLRKALNDPKCHAALVTPDRALGTRVQAELLRFGLKVDDSAGCALSSEPRGVLARLVLDVALSDFEPAKLMALLYHPLVTLGQTREKIEKSVAALDVGVMRTPFLSGSIAALRTAVIAAKLQENSRHMPAPQRRIMADLNTDLLDWIETAFLPFITVLKNNQGSIAELSQAHCAVLEAITCDSEGISHHFNDVDGAVLAKLFDALCAQNQTQLTQISEIYNATFDALLRGESVHHITLSHPRLHIWGPLEARLLDVDLMVIGGLNEGNWPPSVSTDAFLNRPMRAEIGLSPPERRIGQSAHDFACAMGMKQVVLTRSGRQDDQPTIASRFLRRMKAYLGDDAYQNLRLKGEEFVNVARHLDNTRHLDDSHYEDVAHPILRPEPKPALELRPNRFSITEIETLYRDPYAIYAKHVLKLDPLNDRFVEPNAADRGSIVHDALAEFVETYPADLPNQPLNALLNIGEKHFAKLTQYLDVTTYWWPKFKQSAAWFVEFEQKRREQGIKPLVELAGKLEFALSDGSPFTLTCRADRVDLLSDGSFTVIDYKTGATPTIKQVIAGFSPQLTLEAAMVKLGAFKEIPALMSATARLSLREGHKRTVSELFYIKLLGSSTESGKELKITSKEQTPDELAEAHLAELKTHLMRYRDANKGYISRRAPQKVSDKSSFDHLARAKEWAETEAEDDEGDDE
jgi:ATP-dependent helicase/nuclease subunit B